MAALGELVNGAAGAGAVIDLECAEDAAVGVVDGGCDAAAGWGGADTGESEFCSLPCCDSLEAVA